MHMCLHMSACVSVCMQVSALLVMAISMHMPIGKIVEADVGCQIDDNANMSHSIGDQYR